MDDRGAIKTFVIVILVTILVVFGTLLLTGQLQSSPSAEDPSPGTPTDTQPQDTPTPTPTATATPAATPTAETDTGTEGTPTPAPTQVEPPETTFPPDYGESLKVASIEKQIHNGVNAIRGENGLEPLERDSELKSIAKRHSDEMAQYDFYGHSSQDGLSREERYEESGYRCRILTGDRISHGGENLYKMALDDYSLNESEVASQVVSGWMESAGQRNTLMADYWQHQGLGVDVEEEGGRVKIYVTQDFC